MWLVSGRPETSGGEKEDDDRGETSCGRAEPREATAPPPSASRPGEASRLSAAIGEARSGSRAAAVCRAQPTRSRGRARGASQLVVPGGAKTRDGGKTNARCTASRRSSWRGRRCVCL